MLTSRVFLNRHTLGIQKYLNRCSRSVFVSACASVEHHERVGPAHAGVVPAGSGRGSVLVRASQKEAGGGIVPAQCGRAETSQEPRSRETRPHSPAAQRGETDLNAEKLLSESTTTLTAESGVLTNGQLSKWWFTHLRVHVKETHGRFTSEIV